MVLLALPPADHLLNERDRGQFVPEPMQERVAAFVVGSRLGGGCSTTDCCCCAVLPTTSAAFAATSLSFSGALLLNIPTSVCRRHLLRKGQSCLLAIERELTLSLLLPRREDPQVRTPFENRTAQNRTATTRAQTIASHSMYGASPTIHASAPTSVSNWVL